MVVGVLLLILFADQVSARQILVYPSPGDSSTHLTRALSEAEPGDSLILYPGLYRGTFTLKNGVSLLGRSGPDSTLLDAAGGRYVLFGRGLDSTTVISGLTLQNGRRDHPNSGGGGIYLHRSSPVIINNVFRDHLGYFGAGVYCNYDSRPIVAFNVFYNNEGYLGGAIAAYQDCSPLYYNNIIYDNHGVSGGGILCMNSTAVILQNTIVGNTAQGGAIYCDSSPAVDRGQRPGPQRPGRCDLLAGRRSPGNNAQKSSLAKRRRKSRGYGRRVPWASMGTVAKIRGFEISMPVNSSACPRRARPAANRLPVPIDGIHTSLPEIPDSVLAVWQEWLRRHAEN